MIGKRFGKLTATEVIKRSSKLGNLVKCLCDCGTEVTVHRANLATGNTKSCGCLKRDANDLPFRGASRLREYQVWKLMRLRCSDPADKSFSNYGARGIKVCEEWEKSFSAFFRDMGRRPSDKHTLDRIDTDGNYEPSNCRWITLQEQQSNRRSNHVMDIDGVRMTLKQVAERYGVNYANLRYRVRAGWPLGKALSPGLFDPSGNPK